VNSAQSEIGPCLFPDGVTLVYSRRDPQQDAYDLILTAYIEGEWLDPIPLGRPFYTAGEERLASITADGTEIYFTAVRNGGSGSFDLYSAVRGHGDESWGPPENLGTVVNSAESDYSPGISPDGKLLFFSSQRDEPGNFDLYVCRRQRSGWGEPERLEAPINSRMTEYCPSIGPDGSLYFASDRRYGRVEQAPEIEE